MHDEQFATEPFCKIDRRTTAIPLGIFVRQAHVAFLIDGVVKPLIGHGGYRYANAKQIR